jgi:hypothetical protein
MMMMDPRGLGLVGSSRCAASKIRFCDQLQSEVFEQHGLISAQ